MSALDNINYLKRFAFYPCATPSPALIVETAFEAVFPVLWEFFSLQIYQTASPTAKRIGAKSAPTFPLPQTGDRGGQKVQKSKGHGYHLSPKGPPDHRVNGERWGPNTYFFRAADVVQKYLYYMVLADLATDFAARWTTLIYKKQDCPFDHQCYKQTTFGWSFPPNSSGALLGPFTSAGCILFNGRQIEIPFGVGTDHIVQPASFSWTGSIHEMGNPAKPANSAYFVVLNREGAIVQGGPGQMYADANGNRRAGGLVQVHRGSKAWWYQITLVNPDPTQYVTCSDGVIMLDCARCTIIAPEIPFDAAHLLPRLL